MSYSCLIPADAGMTSGDSRLRGNEGILTRRTLQKGQSLVEVTLTLLLVLIPLFVFNWFLNAHYNARTDTLAAARYAAWERTVWLDNAVKEKETDGKGRTQEEIGQFMLERVFIKNDAPFSSKLDTEKKVKEANLSFTGLHGYEGEDENGRSKNLLELEETGDAEGKGKRPTLKLGEQGTTTSTIGRTLAAVTDLTGKESQLETRGIYVAEVKVKVNPFTSRLESGLDEEGSQGERGVLDQSLTEMTNVTYTQKVAILTDSWSASGGTEGKRSEEGRVQPMNLGSTKVQAVAKGISDTLFEAMNIFKLVGASPPKRPVWGHIEPGLVPYDARVPDE
jgi:hypothetical protein